MGCVLCFMCRLKHWIAMEHFLQTEDLEVEIDYVGETPQLDESDPNYQYFSAIFNAFKVMFDQYSCWLSLTIIKSERLSCWFSIHSFIFIVHLLIFALWSTYLSPFLSSVYSVDRINQSFQIEPNAEDGESADGIVSSGRDHKKDEEYSRASMSEKILQEEINVRFLFYCLLCCR